MGIVEAVSLCGSSTYEGDFWNNYYNCVVRQRDLSRKYSGTYKSSNNDAFFKNEGPATFDIGNPRQMYLRPWALLPVPKPTRTKMGANQWITYAPDGGEDGSLARFTNFEGGNSEYMSK